MVFCAYGHIYTARLDGDLWLDGDLDWFPGDWPAEGYNHVANGPRPHGDDRWVEAAYLHPVKVLLSPDQMTFSYRPQVTLRSTATKGGCSLSTGTAAATAQTRPTRYTSAWPTRRPGPLWTRYVRRNIYIVEFILKSKVKPLFDKSSNALNLDIVALSSKDGVDLRDGGGSLVLDGSATESEELCVGPGHAGILSAQSSSAITGTWFSPVASQTIRNTITMGWLL